MIHGKPQKLAFLQALYDVAFSKETIQNLIRTADLLQCCMLLDMPTSEGLDSLKIEECETFSKEKAELDCDCH